MTEPTKPNGCIDHCCALMPHGGMGVTGACKCIDDIATYTGAERSHARRKVLNALRWWQAEAKRLDAALARRTKERDRARDWITEQRDPPYTGWLAEALADEPEEVAP